MKKSSKYKGVCLNETTFGGKKFSRWMCTVIIDGVNANSYHETERKAAIAYDMKMIEMGKPPVNILKPKL